MEARLAPSSLAPRRGPWPAIDDGPAPIEEWSLDEVDSAFELSKPFGDGAVDAAFD